LLIELNLLRCKPLSSEGARVSTGLISAAGGKYMLVMSSAGEPSSEVAQGSGSKRLARSELGLCWPILAAWLPYLIFTRITVG